MNPHALVRACCLAGLLHGVLAAPARALESPAPTLATLLDAAWQRSLAQTQADALHQRAQAEQRSAARPWAGAPALELSQRSDRWQRDHGARETELSLGLPLWRYGQRQAQRAAAAGLQELAEAEQAAARLQLAGQLREQAWGLRQLQAAARQAEAQAQGLQQLAADVARRVQAGELAQTDELAAGAEALAAADQQRQAELALAQAQQQWRLLTGLAAPLAAEEADAPQAPAELHPLLRQAQARLQQARQQLELQRRSGHEAPELRLGWRQEQGARGAEREASVQLGLRIPLAPERRNAVELAEAASAVQLAERELERLREQLEAELQGARAALHGAQAQAHSAAAQARLLRQRATLLQQAFQAGELALPELLRALAAATQAEAGQQQSEAALGLARARLLQAQGLLP